MKLYRTIDGTETRDPEVFVDSYKRTADVLLAIFPTGYHLTQYGPGLLFQRAQGGSIELTNSVALDMARNILTLLGDPEAQQNLTRF